MKMPARCCHTEAGEGAETMAAHTPTINYTVTRAPQWVIASRTRQGTDLTVTQVEAADGSPQIFCSCEAGQYGKQCRPAALGV